MKFVSVKNTPLHQIAKIMHKPAFDEVTLGPEAMARVKEVFGRELSAAEVVDTIVKDIRTNGCKALLRYSEVLDGVKLSADTIEVSEAEFEAAAKAVPQDILASIHKAAANVRRFHEEQTPKSWLTYREHGAMLGQSCIPIERVGIYVPGGTASYPSSVVMNAVPASVAGVKEIIMVVPPTRDASVNPYVLAAARASGVHRIFKIGGAHAIAALAFGAGPVPKVDKITGPGNIFVTLAKKAVYGHCDIDMLAGPSEILIIADNSADPKYVAADLLSQAEHDVLSSAVLITDSDELAVAVEAEVKIQLAALPRRSIAAASLERNGMIVVVENIMQAVELANCAAPEHLEVLTAEPFRLLPLIRNAGAIFLGPYSPEPLGDYIAGPNHVLPTGGTARFYSVLNVETFMKKTSIIAYTKEALRLVSGDVIRLAEAEGLDAHAKAIKIREE